MIVTRFAPSPTGPLHLGHAISAIAGHDAARGAGGRFLLRIEDVDAARSRPAHVRAIEHDLRWLGLEWDGAPIVQSERLPSYDEGLARLVAMDLAYPCACSRADVAREVAASLSAPHGADGPLYPGTCRRRPPAASASLLSWRLDAAAAFRRTGSLTWHEVGVGTIAVDPGTLGDVILKGRAQPAGYHLACVLDDAASGVTLITRGRDLLASTHVQRLLQATLGLPAPRYRHHPLIAGPDGRRLAKRDAAAGLAAMRADGAHGPALADALRAGHLPMGYRWVAETT